MWSISRTKQDSSCFQICIEICKLSSRLVQCITSFFWLIVLTICVQCSVVQNSLKMFKRHGIWFGCCKKNSMFSLIMSFFGFPCLKAGKKQCMSYLWKLHLCESTFNEKMVKTVASTFAVCIYSYYFSRLDLWFTHCSPGFVEARMAFFAEEMMFASSKSNVHIQEETTFWLMWKKKYHSYHM